MGSEGIMTKFFKVSEEAIINHGIGLSIVKKIIDFIKEEFGWRVRKRGDYILFYIPKTNGGS
jgi:hypothetical protein